MFLEIDDKSSEDLSAHLDTAIAFIDRALAAATGARLPADKGGHCGGVLIHCFQGKSRSAGVVAAWLMEREALSFDQALEEIRIVRPRACPNMGFALQLRKRGRIMPPTAAHT